MLKGAAAASPTCPKAAPEEREQPGTATGCGVAVWWKEGGREEDSWSHSLPALRQALQADRTHGWRTPYCPWRHKGRCLDTHTVSL